MKDIDVQAKVVSLWTVYFDGFQIYESIPKWPL